MKIFILAFVLFNHYAVAQESCFLVKEKHIADQSKQETYASFRSKNEAMTKLWYLIDELEK